MLPVAPDFLGGRAGGFAVGRVRGVEEVNQRGKVGLAERTDLGQEGLS
jgi:hypothetical protein